MVSFHQEAGDVAHVVDTSSQLVGGAKIVDSDEKSLALARALTVLKGVFVGCSVAETLDSGRHGGRAILSSVAGGGRVELLVVVLLLLLLRLLGSAVAAVALLLGGILVLRRILLLRRVLLLLLVVLRRVVLLVRRALVIAAVAGLGGRSPLSLSLSLRRSPLTRRRSLVVISGAVALSWIHADW